MRIPQEPWAIAPYYSSPPSLRPLDYLTPRPLTTGLTCRFHRLFRWPLGLFIIAGAGRQTAGAQNTAKYPTSPPGLPFYGRGRQRQAVAPSSLSCCAPFDVYRQPGSSNGNRLCAVKAVVSYNPRTLQLFYDPNQSAEIWLFSSVRFERDVRLAFLLCSLMQIQLCVYVDKLAPFTRV
eukprot:Gb_39476 [translate_table: standard]